LSVVENTRKVILIGVPYCDLIFEQHWIAIYIDLRMMLAGFFPGTPYKVSKATSNWYHLSVPLSSSF
jgi:hypothetical protein